MKSGEGYHYGLSGNALKIIAALSMLIDHIGFVLLPNIAILRIIGRLAFPIYAFMISEGCAYTKNRLRYFLTVFVLGVLCQIVYYLYDGSTDMGILITFSLSILVIYAMQYLKETVFDSECGRIKQWVAFLMLCAVIAVVYLLNMYVDIAYGFAGCMTPVLASVFRKTRSGSLICFERLDHRIVHVLMLGIGLIIISLSCELGVIQFYSLISIPLLMLYSGRRGKYKMKYFFYIFYPVHLVVLECISEIIR